ncbi:MAG: hypothetical protein Ta2D_00370 [Rickettsiales bacterium]|nr:MAG: hypothetical protein Ta2D_00370 [Rickettsiales bacterium]
MAEMILKLNNNVFNTISKIVSLQGINLKDYLFLPAKNTNAKTKNVKKKKKTALDVFGLKLPEGMDYIEFERDRTAKYRENQFNIFDSLKCPDLELTAEEEQYFTKPDRTGNYRSVNL